MNEELRRDDEEPAQLGQRSDQILADAIGKILLLWITAHVGERKYRDGGSIAKHRISPKKWQNIRLR